MGDSTKHDPAKAAAITYDVGKDVAPRVTASGKGMIAERIIALAREHGVPLHEDPTLVEMLVKLDLGDSIPYELYQAVAEVLAFIYRIERRAKEGLL
ncbi:MAG TPA: EscU/YscU/HrcU family type III secretion system export apparatus switch protein [bacterium]|nr:EscU/YscU/HrcU family type III secretion system export apparatus switch protein [bacterium]